MESRSFEAIVEAARQPGGRATWQPRACLAARHARQLVWKPCREATYKHAAKMSRGHAAKMSSAEMSALYTNQAASGPSSLGPQAAADRRPDLRSAVVESVKRRVEEAGSGSGRPRAAGRQGARQRGRQRGSGCRKQAEGGSRRLAVGSHHTMYIYIYISNIYIYKYTHLSLYIYIYIHIIHLIIIIIIIINDYYYNYYNVYINIYIYIYTLYYWACYIFGCRSCRCLYEVSAQNRRPGPICSLSVPRPMLV